MHIYRVPSVDSSIVNNFQEGSAYRVSVKVDRVDTRLTSFSMRHGAQCLGPKLMAPMMGTEILRPLCQDGRRTYSAFEFSRDLFRDSGNSGVAMVKDVSEW
jgi:hypothetical protein